MGREKPTSVAHVAAKGDVGAETPFPPFCLNQNQRAFTLALVLELHVC